MPKNNAQKKATTHGETAGQMERDIMTYFVKWEVKLEGSRNIQRVTQTHSTHFIYSYMASDIWLRTILIVWKETRCHHIGYSFQLAARVLLYAPSHRQNSTYHGLCYTNRGALAGTRNSSLGPPHEGLIRRPIAPWANALTMELHLALTQKCDAIFTFDFTYAWQLGFCSKGKPERTDQ